MPMSANVLSAAIQAAIASIPEDGRNHDAVWDAIASAIITHIQTTAVVTVASVSGVTPGIGVSGPGVGTIS